MRDCNEKGSKAEGHCCLIDVECIRTRVLGCQQDKGQSTDVSSVAVQAMPYLHSSAIAGHIKQVNAPVACNSIEQHGSACL